MGSSIKINSISIDLGANDKIGKGKCEHFSIRGFVSEIRKRDSKKCWPFSLNGDCNEQSCVLPPLSVPKSRWWCCEGCLQDISTESKQSVLVKKDGCKSTDSCKAGNNSKRIIRLEDASEKSKGKVSISKKVPQPENCGVVHDQDAEAATAFGPSSIAGVVDDSHKVIKNSISDHPSMQLDEPDNVSSESAILMRSVNDRNPNSLVGSHARKTRKVRLLSEILSKADPKTSLSRNHPSPSKAELVKVRKRKLAEDEEWRPPKVSPQNIYASRKLVKVGKGPGRTTPGSDSRDSSGSGTGSETSDESGSTDSECERDTIKDGKNSTRSWEVNERLLEVPQENRQKGVRGNDEDSNKVVADDATLVRSVRSAFTGRELLPCHLHSQTVDGKPFLPKKKNQKPQNISGKNPTDAISSGGTKEKMSSQTRKLGLIRNDLRNLAVQNVSKRKGLESSLASERHAQSRLEDRRLISFPWQEPPRKKDYIRANDTMTNHFHELGLSSKSEQDAYLRTGVYIDLNGKNGGARQVSFANQKLRHGPTTEPGDYPISQQKETSNPQDKGKTVVAQQHSGTSKSQVDRNPENSTEHLDDIPMEIVELMAKNQYERCLPDGEGNHNDRQASQATSTSKNTLLIDLNKTYENGVSQEDSNNTSSRKPNPHAANTRKMGENFLAAHGKSIDFSQMNLCGQASLPGFGIHPQNREYPSSCIQFSGTGSIGHASTSHNFGWARNIAKTDGQSSSSSSFRVLKPCNTCQSVPQQHKEPSDHLLSPMMPPNHLPVSYNMPQKYLDNSTKRDVLSKTPNSDMNSWNVNFLNLQNQKHGFDPEYAFGCKHSGINRSVDQYHNESSIPAMHLLSLMDPRLRSNTLIDPTGNGRFPKTPGFCQVHQSKEVVGLQPGDFNKGTNTVKNPVFDFYGKKLSTDFSQETFASIPVGASTFSLQTERSFSKPGDFTAQTSMKHQEKPGKTATNNSSMYNGQRSVFSSGDLRKFRFPGGSASTMLPSKTVTAGNPRKQKGTAQNHSAAARPQKGVSESLICGVNRNPADFTVAEPGNPYMIKGKDLKFRRRLGLSKKTGLSTGQKQNKKLVTI